MKFIRRFWWVIVIGALIGGAVMWWRNAAEAKERESNSYTVERQNLTETISLSGEVDAKEKADVKFQTSGLLSWVGVKEGEYVKKYQVLASLDRRELQNSLSQYMNAYMKERWDFEQEEADNKDWQTRGMTGAARDTVKRTLQKNQFDLNNSVLAFEAKDLAMKFASIWAPFEGVITHIDVPAPGTNITPAGAVFRVVNPKSLFFSATADQTEVVNFKVGQESKIVLESYPDVEIGGIIESISFTPKEDESGTVYELKMTLDTAQLGEDALKLGMTGDANFVLKESKETLAIPEAYLKEEKDKYFVSVIKNGVTEKVEIIRGDTIDGMVIIKGGINEGDTIYNQP